MESSRIFGLRRLAAGSLPVAHEDAEVRTPHLRIALRTGRNITTDYALLGRAVPFAHRMARPQISVVLAGEGRAEELGRRHWLRPRDFIVSDGGARRGGSMAYTGAQLSQLLVEWDPAVFGAPYDRELQSSSLSEPDRQRLQTAARRAVSGPRSVEGINEVLAILRSIGAPFDRVDLPSLRATPPGLATLQAVLTAQLSSLDRFPSIDDVGASLEWNQRRIHRGIKQLAERFVLPWSEWRTALHSQRLLAATRLLSAPGATTEGVAQLTGFRSPSSLCHAFANAGLPSPGALARTAHREVLDAWTSFESRPPPADRAGPEARLEP